MVNDRPSTRFTSSPLANGPNGDHLLPAAWVAGAAMVTLLLSAAAAVTTPTAAQMFDATPNSGQGVSYRLRIINTNGSTLTITPDASITLTGTATIASNTWREFDITFTASFTTNGAVVTPVVTATMQSVGTGSTS